MPNIKAIGLHERIRSSGRAVETGRTHRIVADTANMTGRMDRRMSSMLTTGHWVGGTWKVCSCRCGCADMCNLSARGWCCGVYDWNSDGGRHGVSHQVGVPAEDAATCAQTNTSRKGVRKGAGAKILWPCTSPKKAGKGRKRSQDHKHACLCPDFTSLKTLLKMNSPLHW